MSGDSIGSGVPGSGERYSGGGVTDSEGPYSGGGVTYSGVPGSGAPVLPLSIFSYTGVKSPTNASAMVSLREAMDSSDR